jgi:hypothetical protein
MGAWTPGCAYTPGFDSPDPEMRLRAIVLAADSRDPADFPKLVEQLDSQDAEARMLAIRVLERRTGTTRGYDYAASRADRLPSLKLWQAWAAQYAAPAAMPQVAGAGPAERGVRGEAE